MSKLPDHLVTLQALKAEFQAAAAACPTLRMMVTGDTFEQGGVQTSSGIPMSRDRILELDAFCLTQFHGFDEVRYLDLSSVPGCKEKGMVSLRGKRHDTDRFITLATRAGSHLPPKRERCLHAAAWADFIIQTARSHSGNLLDEADPQQHRGYDELPENPFILSIAAIDLAMQASTAPNEEAKPHTPTNRINTNSDTHTVVLDDVAILVENRTVFKVFAALVAAHNEGRTPIDRFALFEAAGRKRNIDPRPERLFRKLPLALLDLIESEAVANGGYSLKLPADKKNK